MKNPISNMPYHYKLYGLHIASQLELSELVRDSDKEPYDILIIKQQMPDEIKKAAYAGIHYHFSPYDMWYEVENLGTYHISNANLIEIDYNENAIFQDVKAYLLGTAFGCLMAQRQQIAIHGGTVILNEKALIFTGESGSGKSTLTTALRCKGNPFLADDVSVISFNSSNQAAVEPAFPQQKLCEDAMYQMGYSIEQYVQIDEDRHKYLLPAHHQFITHVVPLGGIIELSIANVPDVQVEEVRGMEKLDLILRNIYRRSIWNYIPMPPKYFTQCITLSKQIPIYKLQRPEGQYTVNTQIALLAKILNLQQESVV